MVVSTPPGGGFLSPTHTHLTQTALASWQTTFPKHLSVHYKQKNYIYNHHSTKKAEKLNQDVVPLFGSQVALLLFSVLSVCLTGKTQPAGLYM